MSDEREHDAGRGTADIVRMIEDLRRLRGELRISVRQTEDGLGIFVPPARRYALVAFISLWLCGWAVGFYFVTAEFLGGGIGLPDLFLLIWLVPWTIGGCVVFWAIGWQLFGEERLYFTAGALVREWKLLAFSGRRVLQGSDIRSVTVDDKMSEDLAGVGTVKVATTGRKMRIGSGLPRYEAELVADLIRNAARESGGNVAL